MKKLLFFLALLVSGEVFGFTFFSQSKYKLYSKSDGLNNNTVSAIYQDNDGYLWLGTDLGLTRSDGVNFRHYTFLEAGGSFVTDICQLKDSLLWCSSIGYVTPVCFDTHYGREVELLGMDESYLQTLKSFCVANEKLYAVCNSKLIHIATEYTGSSITLTPQELPFDTPIERVFSDSHSLYFITGDSLIKYNPISGEQHKVHLSDLGIASSDKVTSIRIFANNVFLFGPAILPVYYNMQSGEAITLDTKNPIVDIQAVNSDYYVFATWDLISILSLKDERIWNLFDNMAPYSAIFKNRINEMYYDSRSEVLWTGITGRGLMKISFRGDRVKHIEIPSNVRTVNGITQDREGYIWISTDTKGVFRSTTNEISPKMHFEPFDVVREDRCILYQDDLAICGLATIEAR